jgi:hypothetical protein
VGAKANKLQRIGVRLAVDQNEIGTDVAITVVDQISAERMVLVSGGQRSVRSKKLQESLEGLTENFTETASLLSLEVLAKAGCRLNPAHSGRP